MRGGWGAGARASEAARRAVECMRGHAQRPSLAAGGWRGPAAGRGEEGRGGEGRGGVGGKPAPASRGRAASGRTSSSVHLRWAAASKSDGGRRKEGSVLVCLCLCGCERVKSVGCDKSRGGQSGREGSRPSSAWQLSLGNTTEQNRQGQTNKETGNRDWGRKEEDGTAGSDRAELSQLGLEQRRNGGVVQVLCGVQSRGAIGAGQTRVGAQRQQNADCGLVAKLAGHHKS